MAIATFILTISHLVLLTISVPHSKSESFLVIIPLCMVGFAYSIFLVSIWPSIPIVVDPNWLGVAFGFAVVFQWIGLSISQPIVNLLKRNDNSEENQLLSERNNPNMYDLVMIYFIAWSVIAFTLSLSLYIIDKVNYIKVRARIREDQRRLLISMNRI